MTHSDTASGILQAGAMAPDFALSSSPERRTRLSELRGRPTVLVFYPADWSPVCSDELSVFGAARPLLEARQAQVLGISVDSVWSHQAFKQARGIQFDLLADFEPKGEVSRAYGVYDAAGFSKRGLFVIDKDGRIAWSYLSPVSVNPGVDGVLDALDRLEK